MSGIQMPRHEQVGVLRFQGRFVTGVVKRERERAVAPYNYEMAFYGSAVLLASICVFN